MPFDLPLNRPAKPRDYKKACKELAKALHYHPLTPIPPWLDNTSEGKAAIYELMAYHHLYPSRQNGSDGSLIVIRYGDLSTDIRVILISEHETKELAVAFGVVLALTSALTLGFIEAPQATSTIHH